MTRLLVAAALVVLGVAVVGTTRGVERERYVAANEAILEQLPAYPGSRVRSVQSKPDGPAALLASPASCSSVPSTSSRLRSDALRMRGSARPNLR